MNEKAERARERERAHHLPGSQQVFDRCAANPRTTKGPTKRHCQLDCTSRFVRVFLAQEPCWSYLYRSNLNGREEKRGREKPRDRRREGGCHQVHPSCVWAAANCACASTFVHAAGVNLTCQAPHHPPEPFFATAPHARRQTFAREVRGVV